ncbi:MAG: hypothetical protein ACT4O9_08555 [Blastocatellia bacterium]
MSTVYIKTFLAVIIVVCSVFFHGCRAAETGLAFTHVKTIAGHNGEFGEPFGIAIKGQDIYVSDGESGKIHKLAANGRIEDFAVGLDTPSGMAFEATGDLIVADSGSHAIKRIDSEGNVSILAGVENEGGFADGDAAAAQFNASVGVAAAKDGKIFVADTYNDRIRVIENGAVRTLAGGTKGYADGLQAMFDTPLGIAIWQDDKLLVADAGNRRIRVVEADGRVWTLAGSGGGDLQDGLPSLASFVRPTAIAVSGDGVIYIADGNAIRTLGRRVLPYVETISIERRGFGDGTPSVSQFNRPSGLAFDSNGRLLAVDSDNGLVRAFETILEPQKKPAEEMPGLKPITAEEFRSLQPPRWPFDPPEAKRDIAGTLGEIRGEIVDENSEAWFHNGMDIAGAYGEIARFVRDEKVLHPMAAENFNTSRELLRMTTMGYIHLRLGRDQNDQSFGDDRFQFSNGLDGKYNDVRVPRGAKFKAGEPIGTLNAMNHIHLIAGRNGAEMNALDALTLPNVSDSIAPVIEKVSLFDENWNEIETARAGSRIKLVGKTRIVVRAFDRMDGNPERRKLGVYKLGYQLLDSNSSPLNEVNWSIVFDRMPPHEAVKTVYARGSKSGATGETIFNYIVTNRLDAAGYGEGFFDTAPLDNGIYNIRVFVSDFFGKATSKAIPIEVKR